MGYTASSSIERVKLKAWTSTSSALSDGQILELLDDSLRSYVVPFLKAVRDEWFTKGTETVTADANARIPMPNSVASTIRTIFWLNNGLLVPLPRIEPERMFAYINRGAGQPVGYMLKGYEIQLLPNNIGSVQARIDFMERPAAMVLEEDAGLIEAVGAFALMLDEVPLAWQSSAPSFVDVISSESPFSPAFESVEVASLVGNTLTLVSSTSGISAGDWVADVGSSPYPNIPVELHPLLQLDVMRTIYEGTGDKRLGGIEKRQEKMEAELRKTLSPRTQGSARPIVNPSAPGMATAWAWRGR